MPFSHSAKGSPRHLNVMSASTVGVELVVTWYCKFHLFTSLAGEEEIDKHSKLSTWGIEKTKRLVIL